MSLKGKLVSEIEIKSNGDVFHEILRHRPQHIATICSDNIKNVEIQEGECGTIGTIKSWNFTHDGKEMELKEVVEEIDDEKKMMKKKIIEGFIMEWYNSLYVTIHVDIKGENNLVTWTLEYEKKKANVPDPHYFMELCLMLTKQIEAYHIK